MQAAHDLWAAELKAKALIRKVKPLSAAALAVALSKLNSEHLVTLTWPVRLKKI
jgi:hypothetical protein